jgi:putative flippase GtrA
VTALKTRLDESAFRRFSVFLLVGRLNTLVGYGLFAGLVLLELGRTLSLAGSTIPGVLFNFESIGRLVLKIETTACSPASSASMSASFCLISAACTRCRRRGSHFWSRGS